MKGLDDFRAFVRGLGPDQLALLIGLRELLHRADERGTAERGIWIASLRDRLESIAARHGGGGAPLLASDAEERGPLVERGVLRPLEEAGLAVRHPSGEAWESVSVTAESWSALEGAREDALVELDRIAEALELQLGQRIRVPETAAPEGDGSRLSAAGLTKIYRKRKVVNAVDISVTQGEIVGLLGPNGAGKTTTFYMMVGLIPPNEGRVFLDGKELTNTPMFRRARMGVGYLSQEPSIFRKLTVEENVLAILETLELSRADRKHRLEELLGELSIAHLRKHKAYSLSGGERRRLEITRALVQRPKFMLLDEPFAGIDPIAVNDIQTIVADLRLRGIGVIITDHNVEQTLEIVDRAYIMYEGRIRVSGSVAELVWNEEVAEIYLGPILTERMRKRFPSTDGNGAGVR